MLFTELGRHLAPGPFASTVIAAWVGARPPAPASWPSDLFEGRRPRRPRGRRLRARRRAGRAGRALRGNDAATSAEVAGARPRRERRPLGAPARASSAGDVAEPWTTRCARARAAARLGDGARDRRRRPRHVRRLREDPDPVRQADRHVPGGEAPLRRTWPSAVHAARAQTLFAGYHVEARAADAAFQSAAAKIDRHEGGEAQHRRQRAEPRRHRLHRRARRRPLRPAGPHVRVRARRGARASADACSRPTGTASRRWPPPVEHWFGTARRSR